MNPPVHRRIRTAAPTPRPLSFSKSFVLAFATWSAGASPAERTTGLECTLMSSAVQMGQLAFLHLSMERDFLRQLLLPAALSEEVPQATKQSAHVTS